MRLTHISIEFNKKRNKDGNEALNPKIEYEVILKGNLY